MRELEEDLIVNRKVYPTMYDFPNNETLLYILQQFAEDNRVIGAVGSGITGQADIKAAASKMQQMIKQG